VEIARALETAIHAGHLRPGAVLPTIRELASQLNVSAATASAAYRRLHSRGLLTADRRRGTQVRAYDAMHLKPAGSRSLVPEGLIDLASGNPDPELLPSIGDGLQFSPSDPVMYGSMPESRALVALAKGEFAADGVAASDVLVTGGGLDAIDRLLRDHARPGDRVALEDPAAPALLDLLAVSGFTADPVAVDDEGPLPEAMAAALSRRPAAVIVTPRAQNPTGARITSDRAADLRRTIASHQALLIENDPLGPVSGAPAVTLTSGYARWAIVRSVTKVLGPDLRVAIVAGDELTLARMRARQAVGPRWVSHVLQQLAVALWSDPSRGRHLARVADTYAVRRHALIESLAAHRITVRAPSGFNVWIPVRHESSVVEQMAERGWAVAAGERFRLGSGPGIRVTTSALAPTAATRFAEDLVMAMQSGAPLGA
jgi:DNA-binding transcriptional MocR family regulator